MGNRYRTNETIGRALPWYPFPIAISLPLWYDKAMAQATNAITNPSPEKRSGRKRTVLRMALVVLILLLLPVVSIGSPLLQNGGFEEDFHHQPGISGEVADGWVAYNEVGNPTYLGHKHLRRRRLGREDRGQ